MHLPENSCSGRSATTSSASLKLEQPPSAVSGAFALGCISDVLTLRVRMSCGLPPELDSDKLWQLPFAEEVSRV